MRRRGADGAGSPRRRGANGKLSAYLFAAYMLLSVLLLGGAHRLSVVFLALLLVPAAWWLLRIQRVPLDNAGLVVLACGVWTVVALPPLPMKLVGVLSPQAAALWADALRPLRQPPPGWAPLALDLGAAWLEALKWFAYVLVAAWSAQVARGSGLRSVISVVFGVATVLAVVTLCHALLGLDAVFGIYHPRTGAHPSGVSLLINPNNRAGYLNLGGFCGLGLFVSRRPPVPKPFLALGVVLCFASSVWSGSRGGVAILFGLLLVLCLVWAPRLLRHKDGMEWMPRVAGVAAVVLGLPTLALLGFNPTLTRELFSTDLRKLEQLPHLVPAAKDYWLFGVGRGGFESVSEQYIPSGSTAMFRYVENFIGSWAIEWGLPFTAMLLILLALGLSPRRLRLRPAPPAQAAYFGVWSVLLQNVADLGLELFALTSTTIAVIAALMASRTERGGEDSAASKPSIRIWGSRLAMGGLALCVLGTLLTGPDAYASRDELAAHWDAVERGEEKVTELPALLKAEILKRPADPYPFLVGSLSAREVGGPILPWAGAALKRGPNNARAHLMVALGLQQRGAKRQMLYHLVEALRYDLGLAKIVTGLASDLSRDPEFYIKAVSKDHWGARLLIGVASSWNSKEFALERRTMAEAAVERDPTYARALEFLANELVSQLASLKRLCSTRGEVPNCSQGAGERADLTKKAEDLATQLSGIDACAGLLAHARIQKVNDRGQEALDRLGNCSACENRASCARLGLDIAQEIEDTEARKRFEQLYLGAACVDYNACADAEYAIGSMAERKGDWLTAYAHYQKAAARGAKGEHYLGVAKMAARAGLAFEAERAYKEAVSLGHADPQVKKLVDEARRESVKNMLSP